MSVSGLPFDDIRELVANLPEGNTDIAELADERSEKLNSVFGFENKEAELARWLAEWSGKSPSVTRPMIALFAGTHDVVGSASDQFGESTLKRVTRMAAGGAPVNQVCATHDIGLKVFDLALQFPVADITVSDALDEKGSAATIGFGMEAIAGGVDLLGLAAFGAGAQVCNAAIMHLVSGDPIADFVVSDETETAEKTVDLAKAAIAYHSGNATDPLEILRRLGGREHSAILGGILAARVNHVPVVLDGYTAIVVASLLHQVNPSALDHCRFAVSANMPGYERAQAAIGLNFVTAGFSASDEAAVAGHVIAMMKSLAAIHAQSVPEIE